MSLVDKLMNEAELRIRRKQVLTVTDGNGEIRNDVKVLTPEMQEAINKKKEIERYTVAAKS
jgi:hypothetical protein